MALAAPRKADCDQNHGETEPVIRGCFCRFLNLNKEIEMKKVKQAIEVLRMEGWVAAADRMQVLLGLLPAV